MAITMEIRLKFDLAQVYKDFLLVPFAVEGGWQGTVFDPEEGDRMWGDEGTEI